MSNGMIGNKSLKNIQLGTIGVKSPRRFVYILPEIQNKICPEMFESLLHIHCKGSNSVDSSIISLLNKMGKQPYKEYMN